MTLANQIAAAASQNLKSAVKAAKPQGVVERLMAGSWTPDALRLKTANGALFQAARLLEDPARLNQVVAMAKANGFQDAAEFAQARAAKPASYFANLRAFRA